MRWKKNSIEGLRKQLERVQLSVGGIKSVIAELEENKLELAKDRDNQPLKIGDDTVKFLTKRRHSSTTGVFYKRSRNKSRIISRDPKKKEVFHVPLNLKVAKE